MGLAIYDCAKKQSVGIAITSDRCFHGRRKIIMIVFMKKIPARLDKVDDFWDHGTKVNGHL